MEQDLFLFGVNAGGLAYTDTDGNFYQADTFGTGNTFSITAPISGTVDDVLYQSEVWKVGGFTYEITLAAGLYFVELNFAEIWSGAFDPGDRVFDVYLEGLLVEDNLDIVAAAGGPLTAYTTGYFINVTDGALTLTTTSEIENPKLSAFSVWSVAAEPGPDTTAPTVAIDVGIAATAADPVTVTVTYADETGLDAGTISLGDLVISTSGPAVDILSQDLTIALDGFSATATYSVLPAGGWSTTDPVTFAVAGGAIADTSGNINAAAQEVFTFSPPPPDIVAPTVSIAVANVVGASDPATVTVTYQDETGLDPSTISLGDLVISTSGPAVDILSQDLTFAPDGLSATATYSVLPQGGWTADPVTFTVAGGAFADAAGNINLQTQETFTPLPVFLFGVNAGGLAYTDTDGNFYQADTFGAGNTFSITAPISGTVDDVLYQSEVWKVGGFTYEITLAAGLYFVELNFADIWSGTSSPGARVFDVYLEGLLVEDNLDIVAAAGGPLTAYTTGYFIDVTDGALTLTTTSEIENPKLSAFSVWSVAAEPGPDTTAPTVAIDVGIAATAADPVTVTVTYADETGLDPSTISLGDLVISTSGPAVDILSQDLTFAPDGLSATATYSVLPSGGWTAEPVTFTVAGGAIADAAGNPNALAEQSFSFNDPFTGIDPVDPVDPGAVGAVRILVTPSGGIESSIFNSNSFSIENIGDKRIAAVLFDISDALFPDTVFDPVGAAGDSVSRGLLFGSTGGTGAVVVGSAASDPDVLDPFIGQGGTAGYEMMLVRFDPGVDGGFQTGETTLFGVDLDPNSIVGIPQNPVDIDGNNPRLNSWDIGGVSGAELIGATITVLFTDGTRTSGQLMGDGSQSGAIALIDSSSPAFEVELTVNGVAEGGSGLYGAGESVFITGPAGETARVVLATGFAQPFDYIDPSGVLISVADRLAQAGDPFGANNAIEIQTIDVVLTGAPQDITSLFDFNAPGGTLAFAGDDALPIAFTASVIGATGQPLGPVTAPIYLAKEAPPPPPTGVDSLADMTQLALQGVALTNPTSIDVGADGRLYVSQQDGRIVVLTIERVVTTDAMGVTIETWAVTSREDITLVQDMPNHDDSGVYQSGVVNRQVTGLVTTLDANGNVVLYVTSSDPRIGGGGSGADLDLDTNSGILSRLTQVDDGTGNLVWEKVDLIRGFPRSEENHSLNGLQLSTDADGNAVLVATVGGNTNAGAPSFNFAYQPEYFYSGAIITVDLGLLDLLETTQGLKTYTPPGGPVQTYLYDLPTLDDPTRANDTDGGDLAGDGSTTADVFGGNDGLNQAIFDPTGIVKLLATGFRNQYDVLVTESGAIYTIDNGANVGWGGHTVNAAGEILVDTNGDGIADNGPGVNISSEIGLVNNGDALHRVDDDISTADTQIYYAGHPNLIRAYGADAGFYLYANPGNPWGVPAGTPLDIVEGVLTPSTTGPVDLGPLIANADQLIETDALGNPITDERQALLAAVPRLAGVTDSANGALYTWVSSTNGLEEYTAAGGLGGQLLAVSFDGKIYAIEIGPDGEVANVESRALTSAPLDLVAQGDSDPYPGVIFIAAYGADQIVILSPGASQGVMPDPNDRDGDGIDDTIDPFPVDPDNGLLDVIEPDHGHDGHGGLLRWSFVNGEPFPNDRPTMFDGTGGLFNGGDIGFTGVMTNRGGLPESLHTQENIIWGGAPGVLQVKSVEPGDATTDTQRNGFQLGVTPGAEIDSFTVSSLIDNFLDEIGEIPADEKLSQGIFVGAGDQNNFVSVSLVRLADGRVGFEVISQFAFAFIGETPPVITFYEVPELASAGATDTITLGFDIDMATAAVEPTWIYRLGVTETSGSGAAVVLQGDALAALRGTLTLPDDSGGQVPTGFAVGVVSSRSGSPGGGTIAAISAGGDESFTAMIDGTAVTFVPDTQAANVTIVGTSKVASWSESLDIANSALDELYTEERYANAGADWGYTIATGNGTFAVDLYFAETWSGAFADGARVFGIFIEGVEIAASFDIYQTAGGANLETVISYNAVVTDGALDISFSSVIENAKVNAVLVRELGAPGVFAADWDDLEIEGFAGPDITPPVATISFAGAAVADDPLTVTVLYQDDRDLDPATIALDDLTIASAGPSVEILAQDLTFAPDGLSATATYSVLPIGGWTADPVTFTVAGGAVADAAGNGNAEAQEAFTFTPPPPDLVAPTVAIDVGIALNAADPITVTVTYADETGLDAATIALDDLTIASAGPSVEILAQDLTFAPDGLSATATYSVLPSGGWTADPVTFTVAGGAVADAAGNGNAEAQEAFTFVSYDTFVFALNAGGSEYTTAEGVTYQADTFGAGNVFTTTLAIAGTVDDVLYQSETWKVGGFVYDIPVANGVYRVELDFADIYSGTSAPGARVFDVFLEDQLVFDDLDIVAAAGGPLTAYTVEALVEVTDGALTLSTSPEIENPKISAFSIWADDLVV